MGKELDGSLDGQGTGWLPRWARNWLAPGDKRDQTFLNQIRAKAMSRSCLKDPIQIDKVLMYVSDGKEPARRVCNLEEQND